MVETPSLQWLQYMLHTQRQHLSICQWLCYYLNHNSICAHRDLLHIQAPRRHNGISLWMNRVPKINGPMIHAAPNSRLALKGCPKLYGMKNRKKKTN